MALIDQALLANDLSVISDATVGSTVSLTGGNLNAQAALIIDAHINSALSAQFNAFFQPRID
jgi:hypothetical protein